MKYILSALVLVLLSPLSAQADYFVWKDAHSDIKLTYPDTWAQTSPYEPDTIIRVEAPGTDMAECKIRVREDRRFLVYPQRYRAAVQEFAYSEDFWNDYLASYDNVIMHRLDNGAGLGNAFASLITASYMTNHPLKGVHKTSLALAGLYRDKAVVYECSARAEAFNNDARVAFLHENAEPRLDWLELTFLRHTHTAHTHTHTLTQPGGSPADAPTD